MIVYESNSFPGGKTQPNRSHPINQTDANTDTSYQKQKIKTPSPYVQSNYIRTHKNIIIAMIGSALF